MYCSEEVKRFILRPNRPSSSLFANWNLAFLLAFFQAEDGIRYYKVTGVQTCALPICCGHESSSFVRPPGDRRHRHTDRKSTRLNSSHLVISYAVFSLKKKKKHTHRTDKPTSHTTEHCRTATAARH